MGYCINERITSGRRHSLRCPLKHWSHLPLVQMVRCFSWLTFFWHCPELSLGKDLWSVLKMSHFYEEMCCSDYVRCRQRLFFRTQMPKRDLAYKLVRFSPRHVFCG